MRYALALAIIASLSFGLVQQSFRYQSTAGLFEDDYDLLFDPARISEIQGSRLWTSLSNFVTSSENLFDNSSVPYILLGGSTRFGNYYPGLVYDRSNQKTGLNTGLVDASGNPIFGEGEVTTINWDDTDNNGTYDARTIATDQRTAYDLFKENNFFVGVGTKMGNLRLGLGLQREASEDRLTAPADNFVFDYTEEDLTTNTVTLRTHADFGGDNVLSDADNGILLSTWLDRENMSHGLAIGYQMTSNNQQHVIMGDSAIFTNPADTTSFFTAAHVLDSLNIPESGNRIGGEFRTFVNYNENNQGRFYLGLFTESSTIGADADGYYNKTRTEIDNDFTWDTVTTHSYFDGKGNAKGFRLGTKQLFKVSDRLRFGIGFFLSSTSHFDSVAVRDTSVEVEVYDDNDGNVIDPDDYVETTWSSETWMTRTTGSDNVLTFPVGIEFNVTQPFVFRLGALHSIVKSNQTVVRNLIQYEPQRVHTDYGDGSVDEDIIDPGPEPVGSEETIVTNNPATDYFYGVGWQVTDNLQIDLMGFAEVTDWTGWEISATLEF